jgi:hypothetical protein
MIVGRGYQTLDSLCALVSGNCGAIFADSPRGFFGARGPPLSSSAGGASVPSGLTATPARHDAGPGGGAAPAQL